MRRNFIEWIKWLNESTVLPSPTPVRQRDFTKGTLLLTIQTFRRLHGEPLYVRLKSGHELEVLSQSIGGQLDGTVPTTKGEVPETSVDSVLNKDRQVIHRVGNQKQIDPSSTPVTPLPPPPPPFRRS